MRANGVALGWLLVMGLAQPLCAGAEVDDRRARIDYMLNCQGCHLPNGEGAGDVPRMTDFVGNFLKVAGGREFLVQVPGSANAPLEDQRLAELLNWMLDEISRNQLPADFRPYTAEEVAKYRTLPLRDVLKTRAQLVQKIALLPR
ncbi:MAG: cytochrome c, class I [Gammaproteobacteria bacterium]|nr:cytochrome c, class I [Gammaproteobacteria bacterium]MDE0364993.1 cytochrome c, class I [Gammaproteobacteria bacterium]